MHLSNIENQRDYLIDANWHAGRANGVSAVVRLQNESQYVIPTLRSIHNHFDEILVVLNRPSDDTEEKVRSLKSERIRVLHYPFMVECPGPGYDEVPENSIHSFTYLSNWALSKTRHSHVCKWDGDMVALPTFKWVRSRLLNADVALYRGVNIVGTGLAHMSKEAPFTAMERLFFRVRQDICFRTRSNFEQLGYPETVKKAFIWEPLFIHLKHAKPVADVVARWPKDWTHSDHYLDIVVRRAAGKPYWGYFPHSLYREMMEQALNASYSSGSREPDLGFLKEIGLLLLDLRNKARFGNLLIISDPSSAKVKAIRRLAKSLFPRSTVTCISCCALANGHPGSSSPSASHCPAPISGPGTAEAGRPAEELAIKPLRLCFALLDAACLIHERKPLQLALDGLGAGGIVVIHGDWRPVLRDLDLHGGCFQSFHPIRQKHHFVVLKRRKPAREHTCPAPLQSGCKPV